MSHVVEDVSDDATCDALFSLKRVASHSTATEDVSDDVAGVAQFKGPVRAVTPRVLDCGMEASGAVGAPPAAREAALVIVDPGDGRAPRGCNPPVVFVGDSGDGHAPRVCPAFQSFFSGAVLASGAVGAPSAVSTPVPGVETSRPVRALSVSASEAGVQTSEASGALRVPSVVSAPASVVGSGSVCSGLVADVSGLSVAAVSVGCGLLAATTNNSVTFGDFVDFFPFRSSRK